MEFLLFVGVLATLLTGVVVAYPIGVAVRRRRVARLLGVLRTIVADLEGGEVLPLDWRKFVAEDQCRARGRLDGLEVNLGFRSSGGPGNPLHATFEVAVPDAAADFEVGEGGVLDDLARLVGVSTGPSLGAGLVLRRGSERALEHVQSEQVRAAVRRLLARPGVSEVSLRQGKLRLEAVHGHGMGLDPAALRETLDVALVLARQCARVPVTITVGARQGETRAADDAPRFAWTAGGTTARCPYCHDDLDPIAAGSCSRCHTIHHRECLDEGGGCAVFGCGARAGQAERASA